MTVVDLGDLIFAYKLSIGAVVEQKFDWEKLLFGVICVTVAICMLFAVMVACLSFSCVGLLLFWFIGAIIPELSERSTIDMVMVHSLVNWITQCMKLDYTA